MIPDQYKESLKALEKAADAIENAKYNYQGEFFGVTANRTYYACYYCLIALLYTQNVYSKTHQGTKAKFSELFIKTGIFPVTVSDAIREAVQSPRRWPGYLYGTRRFVLHRFPFSIIYLDEPDGVTIVAVAHNKRRPGYWKRRL